MSVNSQKATKHMVIQERLDAKDVLFVRPSKNGSKVSDVGSVVAPKLYWQRWLMLFFFYLAVVINSVPYEVFAPISVNITTIYDTSESLITLVATSYMVMHPILSFACAQFIVLYGWAIATNVGIAFTIAGCAARLLINEWGIWIVIFGQALCGIGRPLIFNSQASIASNWFMPQSRTYIITGLNILHTFSLVISTGIPGNWIFRGYKLETDDEDYTKGHDLGFKLMLVEFLITLLLVPSFFILRNKPPSVPSKYTVVENKMSFIQAMKGLFTNINFILIFIPYSVYFGLLKALLIILDYVLHPFGFNSGQVSIAGAIPLVGALLSQAGIPYIINKTKKFKLIVTILLASSTVAVGLLYLAAETGNAIVVYTDTTMVGFFLMPAIPVMMELSCDAIHPIGASFAVGAMYVGATLISVIAQQLLTIIIGGRDSSPNTVLLTIGIYVILMIMAGSAFLGVKVRAPQEYKSDSVHTTLRDHTKSTLYENHSLFNCSMDIGIIGDTPVIDLVEKTEDYQDVHIDQQ